MYDFVKTQANKQLELALDNNHYDESQLIELKVPVNLPYQTSWSSYQRYDGEIEISGVKYKYVKRKLANDTLYLKCIPNTKEMKLQTAKNDFFKNNNDIAQNTSGKSDNSKSVTLKKLISEYDEHSFLFQPLVLSEIKQLFRLYLQNRITTSIHISPEQPPDSLIA